jgi:chemotaxis protein MotB
MFNKIPSMKNKTLLFTLLLATTLSSCVSKKKYTRLETSNRETQMKLDEALGKIRNCDDESASLKRQNDELTKQMAFLKENNTTALKQLENLSVISSSQAESIKKSLDNLGMKDAYIQDLQASMARKDSLNLALVMNLKGAIGNMSDQDINIKVDKGVVYIDISDKLLFQTGKYEVTAKAKEVLGKVAQVLKNQPDIEFMVEGHTDNVPYRSGVLMDNWDLSVKRATAVVRILQNQYGLDPAKMAAAGRGEYHPVAENSSAENKAANRRTRIVILPQLDQFFKLLEPKK